MRSPGPALVLPLFLAGCALPPAVTVASLVADGLSLVTTGKSTTDHAISAFVHEDCALFRVVDGRQICDPDGDVLIALVGANAGDDNWHTDPETGSIGPNATSRWGSASDLEAAVEAAPPQRLQISATPGTPKPRGAASATALTPGLVGQGRNLAALAGAIEAAAPPRGLFADAKPAAKPQQPLEPRLLARFISRLTRLNDRDEQLATYAVIGSFKNSENARRAAQSRVEDAFIQTIVVNGTTTYRVLVDQPVEQARNLGFGDAWPVRLCATDLSSPPCGHLVVSQAGAYLDMTAN